MRENICKKLSLGIKTMTLNGRANELGGSRVQESASELVTFGYFNVLMGSSSGDRQ